jgi:hypothetical protein
VYLLIFLSSVILIAVGIIGIIGSDLTSRWNGERGVMFSIDKWKQTFNCHSRWFTSCRTTFPFSSMLGQNEHTWVSWIKKAVNK